MRQPDRTPSFVSGLSNPHRVGQIRDQGGVYNPVTGG